MFKHKSENQAPRRRLVLCASSSKDVLSDVLKRIDEDTAKAISVVSEEELRVVLERESGQIDDLILFTDLTGEMELLQLVKDIPSEIIIFLIRNKPVNGLLLKKIDEEGVEYLDLEEIGQVYRSGDDEPVEAEEEANKKRLIDKLPKFKTRSGKKEETRKEESKQEESKKEKSKEVEPEAHTHGTSEEDIVIKPKKLRFPTKGKVETPQQAERVIRKLKVTRHQVIVKKQISTKIKRAEHARHRLAVTGLEGAGKTTLALALAWALRDAGKHTALIDLDNLSDRTLADMCGVPDDEDGLDQLLSGNFDPFQLDKKGRLQLFTSQYKAGYEADDTAGLITRASTSFDAVVVDMPLSHISPVQHFDRVFFVMDAEPRRISDQLEALSKNLEMGMAKLTVILNKHTKTCMSRRVLRRELKIAAGKYLNDIHICAFDISDMDYMRRTHSGGIDGSGFVSPKNAVQQIVREMG